MTPRPQTQSPAPTTRVIASEQSWIESEAVRQLEQTAQLPGIRLAVGMPDLHPGRGYPIGAAFLSEDIFYPALVGNDIGCGMALWQTDIVKRKLKLDRATKRLKNLESAWDGDASAWLSDFDVAPTGELDEALGTIGGGNHFAELQRVEEVHDSDRFDALSLRADRLLLLVHSGSRGLGHQILTGHIERFGAKGLSAASDDAIDYLLAHGHAMKWASANRALIAERFMEMIGTSGTRTLDLCHNSVTTRHVNGCQCWLHRKGAAPSDEGPVVIPGSRGAWSYLLDPADIDGAVSAWSLAHGAGRKWSRGSARQKLKRYRREDMLRTKLGSRVICEDKALLFEEAPEAYKDIDVVIHDMVEAGLVRPIAKLRPVITYKTR